MSLADQPAFPRPSSPTRVDTRDGPEPLHYEQSGMTYRQWLVGMALQGLLASAVPGQRLANSDEYAKKALDLADAAIRAQEGGS